MSVALIGAGISALSKGVSAYQKKQQGKAEIKSKRSALKAASRVQPEEAQAMARMRKGAEQGTMDVEKLNMQMSQPLYQQGEAQEAQAMGKITQQGLEGTIIAQEVSRKIGSDVRADIAGQARKIALENEKTKADADRRLQEALFQRGAKLRELGMQRAGLKTAESNLDKAFIGDIVGAGLGLAGDVASFYTPPAGFETRKEYLDYEKRAREKKLIDDNSEETE
jgi:hypothetical protein